MPKKKKLVSCSWPEGRKRIRSSTTLPRRRAVIAGQHWEIEKYPVCILSVVDGKVYDVGLDDSMRASVIDLAAWSQGQVGQHCGGRGTEAEPETGCERAPWKRRLNSRRERQPLRWMRKRVAATNLTHGQSISCLKDPEVGRTKIAEDRREISANKGRRRGTQAIGGAVALNVSLSARCDRREGLSSCAVLPSDRKPKRGHRQDAGSGGS